MGFAIGEHVERAASGAGGLLDGEIATFELATDLGDLAIVELGGHAVETAHAFPACELGIERSLRVPAITVFSPGLITRVPLGGSA
jgi:hypothetical protein